MHRKHSLPRGSGWISSANLGWDLRLTLPEADLGRISALAEGAAARGVQVTTLASERQRDPACIEKLHDLVTAIHIDEPGRAVAPPTFNLKEALVWLEQPYVLADGHFIATLGGDYVGVSDLNLRGVAPGEVMQGFTGVRPACRRQGVAAALKTAAIEYARRRGYDVLRTFNRPGESAIIALNERLGFRRRLSEVTLERCVKEIADVDPGVYDAYVGRYHAPAGRDNRRELTLVVTKEDRRLFAELSGQKVDLFPESPAKFFVKYWRRKSEAPRSLLTWAPGAAGRAEGRMRHLVWLLVVGTLAGWLAGKFMRGRGFGLAGDLIVGIVGSLIGGFIFGLLQISPSGLIGSIVMAFVGAVALLYLVRLLK